MNGTFTRYVYDGADILLEYDGTNTLLARYTHRPGIDDPVIMERDLDSSGGFDSTERFTYHTDGLGSITELTDSSGGVVRAYAYDAYGGVVSETGTLANPFRFTGREYDAESDLYFYRARYYDANSGRFLTEDPLRFAGSDVNLYRYVFNSPVSLVDPSGEALPLAVAIIGVGGVIGGIVNAGVAIASGQGVGGVAIAFGEGFATGALGTAAGLASGGLGPVAAGVAAGLAGELTSQAINLNFDLGALGIAAAIGPLGNKIAGLVKKLKLIGPKPNLGTPRPFSKFGPNSLRLLGQAAVSGGFGAVFGTVAAQLLAHLRSLNFPGLGCGALGRVSGLGLNAL